MWRSSSRNLRELSARIATAGSCYAFSYHTLGELPAVIGSVCLTIEYGISGAGVARSWSSKLAEQLGGRASDAMFFYYSSDKSGDLYVDWAGALLQAACVVILLAGVTMGKIVVDALTLAKVALVNFLIAAGFAACNVNVFENASTFAPAGMSGTIVRSESISDWMQPCAPTLRYTLESPSYTEWDVSFVLRLHRF
jgi:amino acid transporter